MHDNKKLCNRKSNMHESSCKSEKQVMAIWNWSSGELCGPWASVLVLTREFMKRQFYRLL